MDFELSDEQLALQEGIRALAAGRLPLEETRGHEGAADVVDFAQWQALADAGVFSLLVPEDEGGVGLALADAAVVFEELGRVLAAGPIIATCALAPLLPDAAAARAHGVIEEPGRMSAVPALLEHPSSIATLVVLPPMEDAHGQVRCIDPASLELEVIETPLDPLTPLAAVRSALPEGRAINDDVHHRLRQTLMVLSASFQVGIAAQVVDIATEYAKGREQFGRPIGGFQAIKHLLADALCRAELARCAVHAAAVTLDDPQVAAAEGDTLGRSAIETRWRALAGAKLLADDAALLNARTAIQVHGGMGFTWEVPVHLYLKRARVLASSLGTRAQLADMLAALA